MSASQLERVEGLPADAAPVVRRMLRMTDRMERLIGQLLDFATSRRDLLPEINRDLPTDRQLREVPASPITAASR